jgi:hypothetical protein
MTIEMYPYAIYTTDGVPQPWHFDYTTKDEYPAWALEQEKAGKRLVVETLLNAYPDGDWSMWAVGYFDYTDWHSGERI